MKKLLPSLILLVACFAILSSCKKLNSFEYPPDKVNAYTIIADDASNYSLFKYIIDRAGMADEIKDGGYTIFAPTNSAFLSAGYSTTNMQNIPIDTIALIVKNHLVKEKLELSTISTTQQVTSVSGAPITIQKIGERYYADGGDITNQSNHVEKGAFNTINKLLVTGNSIYERLSRYYTSTSNNSFTMLIAAIDKASQSTTNYKQMLSDPAANYTFFAPTNLAFIKSGYANVAAVTAANANTLGGILANHLVNGKKFTTNFDTTQVLNAISGISIYNDRRLADNRYTYFFQNGLITSGGAANMAAGQGIISAVRRFITAPVNVSTLAKIQSDQNLTYFYKALEIGTKAGKYDFLKMLSDNSNSYTVFAVNNAGFQAGGFTSLQSISDANPSMISDLLLYHIANKRLHGGNYNDNSTMETLYFQPNLNGTKTVASIIISNTPAFTVKGPANSTTYTVISPNLVTTNGVLNIVGGILKP